MSDKPASSRIRLKDVAEQANVSVAAVSMALADSPEINTSTRQRIRSLCQKMGYVPRVSRITTQAAQAAAAAQRRLNLGYLLVGTRLQDEAEIIVVHALAREAPALGAQLQISGIEHECPVDHVIQEAARFAGSLDGLLLNGMAPPELLRQLDRLQIPCIMMGHLSVEHERLLPGKCEQIVFDSVEMGRMAADYLLRRHRRIGFISEEMPSGMVHDRFLCGYQIAYARAGQLPDPRWLYVAGHKFADAGLAADAMLALDERPTAYVIPDVRIASNFIQAMANRGHVIAPADVVIAGSRLIAQKYHMEEYPMLAVDMANLASISIHRLQALCRSRKIHKCCVNIPYSTHNLS